MDENAPPPVNAPAAPPPPPPLPPPPPVIMPPPGAPTSRAGRGWMVFAFILLALLALSMLYNMAGFVSSLMHGRSGHYASRTAGPRLEEVLTEDNSSANKVATVDVDGIITSRSIDQSGYNMVDLIKAQLKRAEDDDRVKAVVLKVDSPGGEVLASDEIYHEIMDFQERTHKPVVASMQSLAASGGYYVSAPCRWIVANQLTLTGSIGVIMSAWNYRGLMDKVGVLPQTYKSGKFKDMLSGSRDPSQIPPEEKAMLQHLIDETYARFKSVVQEGREQAHDKNKDGKDKGRSLSNDWEQFADGRVLSGTEAFKLGFVDELGGFQDAVARARKLAGITTANLIEYQQRVDITDLLRLFSKSEAKPVKLDLGVEIPKLQAGQLYFLSPALFH
jgi:protease-4